MGSFSYRVYGEAQPAGSKRAFVPKGGTRPIVTDANPKSKEWKQNVQQAVGTFLREIGWEPSEKPILLKLTFNRTRPKGHFNGKGELNAQGQRNSYPTTRPDATKLLRGVEDALTGIAWKDDSQIVDQHVFKRWDVRPSVEIEVFEVLELG
jgi:Holliday junction resolvase RusA-like endonuclease